MIGSFSTLLIDDFQVFTYLSKLYSIEHEPKGGGGTPYMAQCTGYAQQFDPNSIFILQNEKSWRLLYSSVLKISQFSKDLIWRYYWKKVDGSIFSLFGD